MGLFPPKENYPWHSGRPRGIKNGPKEVVRLGWATEAECKRFLDSANFGNRYHLGALGAHPPLEDALDENPMSLVMASEFVRKLLARWIASKIKMGK
jgi:hypothetical protein